MAIERPASRLANRTLAPSLGARGNRPAPAPLSVGRAGAAAAVEPKTDLLAEQEEAEEINETEQEPAGDAAPAEAEPEVAAQAQAQADAAPAKKPRKPRGPNKKKASRGLDESIDLAALRNEARSLEQEGRSLAGEYHASVASLKQQYEPRIDELRKKYVDLQAKIAAATFGS